MCRRCLIGGWFSKTQVFSVWWSQFESSSSIGRIHDLIGIAAGSNMIGLLSARNWARIVCVLWPADELCECRFPWNLFSSIQYFDVLKIKFIQSMMSRYWWLPENWKKVDNIDAKEITDSTLHFPAKIFWQVQKLMIARELKASWQYRCKRFDWIEFAIFRQVQKLIIAGQLKASWQYRCKRFDWIDFAVFDRNSDVNNWKPQF